MVTRLCLRTLLIGEIEVTELPKRSTKQNPPGDRIVVNPGGEVPEVVVFIVVIP